MREAGYGAEVVGASGISLHKDYIRYAMYKNGSVINREQQVPVYVEANGTAPDAGELTWKRSLSSLQGRTTIKDAKEIIDYGRELQAGIRSGEAGVVLPLIAYYGTGRLWARKQNRSGGYSDLRNQPASRLQGYQDCLSAVSNEKMMLSWFAQMTYLRLQEEQEIPELALVEHAMAECYRGIEITAKSVSVRYSVKLSELEIRIVRQDESVEYLPLHLLSDGIKTILNMVADIAYRMAVLNLQLGQDILNKTPGVVLIDEVDMHLHPAWQKRILSDLRKIFPEIQLIVTTHAPSVLVNTHHEEVRIVSDGMVYVPDVMTYGRSVEAVMSELMGTAVRPADIVKN
ncbi:MAG: AAA family ATPase [Selenomonadaceae bacterium]|nr:AAA family ATPase [Selenomonadaceae bacterium]